MYHSICIIPFSIASLISSGTPEPLSKISNIMLIRYFSLNKILNSIPLNSLGENITGEISEARGSISVSFLKSSVLLVYLHQKSLEYPKKKFLIHFHSTTMNFPHYIRGNYCRKNLLVLKDNIKVCKYHKIGYLKNIPLMRCLFIKLLMR